MIALEDLIEIITSQRSNEMTYYLVNGTYLKQQQKHVELLELYEEFKHEEKYTRIHSRA